MFSSGLELFSLQVVSQHPEFKGKTLKKYALDGVDTVGVWGNEPFEVVFKNNSYQRVQVKLSLDGTDLLTGAPADTEINNNMWVVGPNASLKLKAWPETNKGGAQFVFTSADKGVAANTHGDLSSKGIIAAAVYTEGYVPMTRYIPPVYNNYWYNITGSGFGQFGAGSGNCSSIGRLGQYPYSTTNCSLGDGASNESKTLETKCIGDLRSLAAVGAGEHVEQNITYTTGLTQPVLSQTIKVRYLWWDDVVAACRQQGINPVSGTGFPGDEKQIMSIGKTPRLGYWTAPAFPPPQYARF